MQFSKHKLDSLTSQVLKVVEDVVSNDPTKDPMNLMREEMETSRQHQMKLFQLMLNHRASGSYDHCFNGVPPPPSMAYGIWHNRALPNMAEWRGTKPHQSNISARVFLWRPFSIWFREIPAFTGYYGDFTLRKSIRNLIAFLHVYIQEITHSFLTIMPYLVTVMAQIQINHLNQHNQW